LKSIRLKKLPAQNLPHGEIWPLKTTGKSCFLPEKAGYKLFLIANHPKRSKGANRNPAAPDSETRVAVSRKQYCQVAFSLRKSHLEHF
jgi:hypothetical protein